MTTEKAYSDFLNSLKTIYDEREAVNITDWVFENITGLKRWERRLNKKSELSDKDVDHLQKDLEQLLQHRPVQYVLNEAWFYKMKFYVDENVLIPRPETEELVEWIVNENNKPALVAWQANIIDIGTGSGCIPISLKKKLPGSNVIAIDVSEKALTVAKKNAMDLNAELDFLQVDFLKKDEWRKLGQYEIIVSNPPYIPINEKEFLSKNVTDFEPAIALFVTNNDPFIFYKAITNFAKDHLKAEGKIYVEVHEGYAKEIKKIFEKAGFISEIKNDIYGKERMVKAVNIAG